MQLSQSMSGNNTTLCGRSYECLCGSLVRITLGRYTHCGNTNLALILRDDFRSIAKIPNQTQVTNPLHTVSNTPSKPIISLFLVIIIVINIPQFNFYSQLKLLPHTIFFTNSLLECDNSSSIPKEKKMPHFLLLIFPLSLSD